jgi:hypothetical protein
MHTNCYCVFVILVGVLCFEMKYRVHNSETANGLNTEYLFCYFIFKERVMSTGGAPLIILTSRGFSHWHFQLSYKFRTELAELWDVEVIRYTHRLVMQTRSAVFQLLCIYKLRDVDGTQCPF